MEEWFAAAQDDIDMGAAMRAADSSAGGWNVSNVLGNVQGVTNTVSSLVRSLYQTRRDISGLQTAAAIDTARQQGAIAAETIRARQLTARAAAPGMNVAGFDLGAFMPIIVIGAGALLLRRLAK
jgi:hypothetical protein